MAIAARAVGKPKATSALPAPPSKPSSLTWVEPFRRHPGVRDEDGEDVDGEERPDEERLVERRPSADVR
jgi:hypothetical protein